ncbi:hypothetical protein TorRG33x02_189980 [Trema orientale]|uniref:RNase H type-1 domain-containing protein n=1 Tax=Trema orientale TaxID=63057 RepID=A0A2P5EI23_TREOI|nr:hypothetical protein TorRG33x02_189980 [Trema orientale]
MVAEAAGLLANMRVAHDCRYKSVIFEGDCAAMHGNLLKKLDGVLWDLKLMLQDCKMMCATFQFWGVFLVPREANSGAHDLAHWCAHSNVLGFISINLLLSGLRCIDLWGN